MQTKRIFFWLLAMLTSNAKAARLKCPTPFLGVARSGAWGALLIGSLVMADSQAAPILADTNGVAGKALVDDPAETAKDSLGERGSHNFSDMGSWIWETNTYDRQTVRFWKSFEIPAGAAISRARLRITADNEYILYLDGRELGRDAEWRHLYEYDITTLLQPGRHVLAVEAYNSSREAGFVFGLRVGLASGTVVEVKSDTNWLIVPEDVSGWEKMKEPAASWRRATVEFGFGSGPWGAIDYINLVPPLQPAIIPFRHSGWFEIVLLAICGGVSLFCLSLLTQVLLHRKEQQWLQRERTRIARDIHDGLGTLHDATGVAGRAGAARIAARLPDRRTQLERISGEAREALCAMDEILWAINPRRDTLQEFATFVCGHAQALLKDYSHPMHPGCGAGDVNGGL